MGLEAEEQEDQDPVLGPCKLGPGACTADPEAGHVRTSYSERIYVECSMGCEIWFHQPCWRKFKINVDGVELTGRDYKWGTMAKQKDAPCFNEGCQGIVNYVLGPNKYEYLNKREDVNAKHPQRAAAAAAAKEHPKWAPKEAKGKKGGKKHDTTALLERTGTGVEEEEEDHSIGTAATGEESLGPESSATAGGAKEGDAAASNGNAAGKGRAAPAVVEPQQHEEVYMPLPDDAMLKVRRGNVKGVLILCNYLYERLITMYYYSDY